MISMCPYGVGKTNNTDIQFSALNIKTGGHFPRNPPMRGCEMIQRIVRYDSYIPQKPPEELL